MGLTDNGIPVTNARQWASALSPNPGGTGWNYIAASWPGGSVQVEWNIIKNVTGVPTAWSQSKYFTTTHHYPNNLWSLNTAHGQIRAPNGRIFFPLFGNNFAYYDPTTEVVTEFGSFTESPAIDPNASTTPYTSCFDKGGMLYFATQESQHRPSCVVSVDPSTLAITVLGYVGSDALAFTTYGFRMVADTGGTNKYLYIAYGEDPWQLWALNITPGANFGVATKLYEVTSTGNISFSNIPNKGWTVLIDTDLGQPDNVRTQLWILDGATYAYTAGVDPPGGLARDATPASNPLVGAPQIDDSGGTGIVGWRPNGSGSGVAYTYLDYAVTYADAVSIEELVASPDGVLGLSQSYNGPFDRHLVSASTTWYGPWASGIAQSVGLIVDGINYLIGYPNTALFEFNAANPWQLNVNPLSRGSFAVNGTQNAGTKYPVAAAWASGAGTNGRIYCCGTRERNGSGAGIGSWDRSSHTFAGVYSSTDGSTGPASMKLALPTGLLVDNGLGYVVMSTQLISPPGDALLYIFDYAFNSVATPVVKSGLTNLGQIFPTSTAHVICGVCQGSSSKLALYQYNIQTQTLVTYVELPIVGAIGQMSVHPTNGAVWVMVGNTLVQVDVNTLAVCPLTDLTAQTPIMTMSFASDQKTLFSAGGALPAGIGGANLYSLTIDHPARIRDGRKGYMP